MALIDGQPSVLLQNVSKLIKQKVKDQVELVEKFAFTLYGNVANEDMFGRNDSDLYGAALSLWQTFNTHADDSAKIRVFNPEIARHGWESKHTIVEIVVKDMPFLVDSVRIALNRHNITAHLLLHYPLQTFRDAKGDITEFHKLGTKQNPTTQQTVFHIEIEYQRMFLWLARRRTPVVLAKCEVPKVWGSWVHCKSLLMITFRGDHTCPCSAIWI